MLTVFIHEVYGILLHFHTQSIRYGISKLAHMVFCYYYTMLLFIDEAYGIILFQILSIWYYATFSYIKHMVLYYFQNLSIWFYEIFHT